MKKKYVRIILAIIVTAIIAGIVLYSKNIRNFNFLPNRKNAINENSISSTTIDITYLEDQGNLEHDHIFKTQYNENKHWEECTVCGEKLNEKNHSYTNSWTMGSSNVCNVKNVNKFVCECGYSYESTNGRKGHTMETGVNSNTYYWYYRCSICYYTEQDHLCELSNGSKMTCTNLGRCRLCGTNYNNYTLGHYCYSNKQNYQIGNNIYCDKNCSTYMGIVNKCELLRKSNSVYELYTSITVPSGATFEMVANENYFGNNNVNISNSVSRSGTTWSAVTTITFIEHTETKEIVDIGYYYRMNGVRYTIWCNPGYIYIDTERPTIEIEKNSEELNEWSKTKPIVVSGTENYCNTVTVKIVDEKGETIFDGKGNVNNENYSVTCVPELECDTKGKTFTVIVTDNLGNSSEKNFTISKVDAIQPNPTSGTEILGDWAKSKGFTFTATDYGIGQVQIAFNDIEDLQLATEDGKTFSRDYTFTGDVYHEKELSVMYKDGLGNTSIQKITIDKLDNTAPTITNAQLHNNKLTISANDEHKLLGEGSGVVKYRYLASEEKLANPELTNENSLESTNAEITIEDIYKMKYIYIVAEDYVGNVSGVYEFQAPQLILTSTVNLNTADGKGEVILDWSTYDVTDKYFVVYRKQANQADWETIVPLTQKLTGNTYTDRLGNDKTKPDVPNITITGNAANNNINVTANSTDNGTNYKYYIEAYDSTGTLLSKSN